MILPIREYIPYIITSVKDYNRLVPTLDVGTTSEKAPTYMYFCT